VPFGRFAEPGDEGRPFNPLPATGASAKDAPRHLTMEEIMHFDVSKLYRSRVAATLIAVGGGIVILLTAYSVHPTASRFDAPAHSGAMGRASAPALETAGEILGVDSFFDYSLVYPEQPSAPVQ
jgi:hypothetical protein